jgi:uncharacterized protein (DUF983 family)
MASENPSRRDACPHCGKPAGIRFRDLLPSNARNRAFKCRSCGGLYDLSDTCRIASMLGGLASMFPAIFLFGRIVKAGNGSKWAVVAGTAVLIVLFGVASIVVGTLTLRLQPKR